MILTIPFMCTSIVMYSMPFICCSVVFGRIITPYSMDEFAWSKKMAVLYNNIMFGALAVLAIFTFIGLKLVTK